MRLIRVGRARIESVIDGEVRTPPAAMYPAVHPDSWPGDASFLDPGEPSSVVMSLGGYLVRLDDRLVLVDCGNGANPILPWLSGALRSSLYALGVSPADVTDVVFTHLHADHTGWATRHGRPFFPNAVYRCDRRDWDHFTAPGYRPAEWELQMTHPQDAAGVRLAPVRDRMEFWQGDAEILPGLVAMDACGHTPGTSVVVVESAGERAALLGDVAHTVPELLHAWDFSAHLDHGRAVESTRRVRDWLAGHGVPCAAAHFPGLRWGYVRRSGDEFAWEPVAD